MRTIFVNPSRVRRRKARRRTTRRRRNASLSNPRRRRRAGRRRRRNTGITPFVRNPSLIQNPRRRRRRRNPMPRLGNTIKDTLGVMLGATAGGMVNRLGIQFIDNWWARNLTRLGSATVMMAFFGTGSRFQQISAAAAGATLAAMLPEIETVLSEPGTKNPQELAAELAGLLEADLSDELSDDNLADELADDITW